MKLSRLAPLGIAIHPIVHVASFGLDDLFIILAVGVYFLCRSFR